MGGSQKGLDMQTQTTVSLGNDESKDATRELHRVGMERLNANGRPAEQADADFQHLGDRFIALRTSQVARLDTMVPRWPVGSAHADL